ncbi:MAG: hemerythrin domain-containing protein [Pseudonocardia sp.]|uniref:hemerythrin domain-containing protein n=1 Tax=unclassified Pseudonocardia TaxID=2619320 RepID=UPI0008692072|nr:MULTISPECIES: hemerythrin domain-containing protein [unclassified Pseudonocardia]MBN9110303.1 hemerythrin domain-containing protein [Pseudonocardia sp.]ODU20365.1 MAG: hypothetical protein ABS80_18365 [Pseudonocardia sp. SCN 72-51]ODV06426.1 MAG: hypothetical protein ABT15_13040 [Pseudonocardia sp. SCN 73-27]
MTAATTATADLLGLRLLHRAMRTELHRTTAMAERLADVRTGCSPKRAKAIDKWVRDLCDEIHHHHTAEDLDAWPVIAARAGAAVDLTELSDDHAALDPLLDRLRAASQALANGRPEEQPALASELAAALRVIRDELDEHIEAEERDVFPIVEQYVPAAEWKAVEAAVQKRKGGPGVAFQVPRIVAVTTPQELAAMRKVAGPVLIALLKVITPAHNRRVRLVFG